MVGTPYKAAVQVDVDVNARHVVLTLNVRNKLKADVTTNTTTASDTTAASATATPVKDKEPEKTEKAAEKGKEKSKEKGAKVALISVGLSLYGTVASLTASSAGDSLSQSKALLQSVRFGKDLLAVCHQQSASNELR